MLLRTFGLTKSFGGLTAVDHIDFEIEKGTITAIIGPNGAGKSTFFNLVSGFHAPSEGKIIFNNHDITSLKSYEAAKLGIGRTFQTTHLFEQSTVMDNVMIGHRLRTKSGIMDAILKTGRLKREEKEAREKAYAVLEFTGLTELAGRLVSDISQEAKKRTAFALALATDPQIVFLDEPAAGVNPEETEGLAELMKKMVTKGITVCLIEHKMGMVMSLADRIMVLNYGKKIAEGTPDDIKNNQAVIQAYLGGGETA